METSRLHAISKFTEMGKLEPHKYKSLAYSKAAKELKRLSDDDFNSLNDFTHIANIGTIVNKKILEYKETGEICKLLKLRNPQETL